MESDAQNWTEFVLFTARNASNEARLFICRQKQEDIVSFLGVSSSMSNTRFLDIIGTGSSVASGVLDDYEKVKPRLLEAMELVSDVEGDRYFGTKDLKTVAFMWLNDYMKNLYDMVQRYHDQVVSNASDNYLWNHCPIIVYWEYDANGRGYEQRCGVACKDVSSCPEPFLDFIDRSPVYRPISPGPVNISDMYEDMSAIELAYISDIGDTDMSDPDISGLETIDTHVVLTVPGKRSRVDDACGVPEKHGRYGPAHETATYTPPPVCAIQQWEHWTVTSHYSECG